MRVVELEKEVDNKQSEIDEKDKAIVELTVALDVYSYLLIHDLESHGRYNHGRVP